jgi:hypothetical protein
MNLRAENRVIKVSQQKMTPSSLSYLFYWTDLAINIHKRICSIKFLANDRACSLDPVIFPPRSLEVMQFVTRVKNWEIIKFNIRCNQCESDERTHCNSIHLWMVRLVVVSVEGAFANCEGSANGFRIPGTLSCGCEVSVDVIHSRYHCADAGCIAREKQCSMFKNLNDIVIIE